MIKLITKLCLFQISIIIKLQSTYLSDLGGSVIFDAVSGQPNHPLLRSPYPQIRGIPNHIIEFLECRNQLLMIICALQVLPHE